MTDTPRVLVVIPARGGSKRLPGKNLLPLGGRPLLAYSVGTARAARTVGRIFVSTDGPAIAAYARSLGVEVVDRPTDIAGDHATTLSAIQHATRAATAQGFDADLVVTLQPTCPLRPRGLVDRAVEHIWSTDAGGLLSVTEARIKLGARREGRFHPDYREGTRKQDLPSRFREDGVIYITRRETLDAGSLFGDAPVAEDAGPIAPLANIDYEIDLVIAEALWARYQDALEEPA